MKAGLIDSNSILARWKVPNVKRTADVGQHPSISTGARKLQERSFNWFRRNRIHDHTRY
jgi:hypothetical protein